MTTYPPLVGTVKVTAPGAPPQKVEAPQSGTVLVSPGAPGPRGKPGPTGPSSTLTIGTVTGGETADASLSGESPNQVLSLVLPQGEKGETGGTGPVSTVPGPAGPANHLSIGTVVEGPAAATITGTSPEQELNLTLPPGPKGDQGPAGEVSEAELNQAVSDAVAALIDGSPTALDTLSELAAALGNDPNFAATIAAQIGAKADKTTAMTAGTGLDGGGTLAADRSFSVKYGTDAGTAAEGNDPRLSNARTPVSHTHAMADIVGLVAELAGKAAAAHTHNASDVNAGTLDLARLPATVMRGYSIVVQAAAPSGAAGTQITFRTG
ncbi:hypothetical protein L5G28_07845 [Gordonia sp. HY285]|uniref:hypothetical protein n=1 Tax=Gordonia liuliyuniae TaxID=2911517 RepID=UPI001F2BF9FF|nr:hypothetical protein [Gordonia liuliyuniae]MCF8610074.1 hypothetical protein [Gordonia liuliyuniae]